MERDYLFSGFLSKLSWQMAATLTFVIVTFLQSVTIANSLGVREFGIWSSIVGFSVIASQLVDPRYLDFLLKFLTKLYIKEKEFIAKQLVYICLLLSLFLLLITVLTSLLLVPIISDYFGLQVNNLQLILILALVSTFSHTHFLTIFQAFFRVKGMVKELSIICIILYLFRYFSIFIALKFSDSGILGISTSFAFVNFIFMVFCLLFIRSRLSKRSFIENMKIKSLKENYKGAAIMLRRLHLSSIASIPQKELDITILTVFSSPESIGIYRVAKNFVVALWAFVDGISLVIFPKITELHLKDNFTELRSMIIKLSLYTSLVLFT